MDYHTFSKPAGERFGPINWAPYGSVSLSDEKSDGRTDCEFPRPYFVNRHVRPEVSFDWSHRVDRDTLGMDEYPLGCHVSAAALPPGSSRDIENDDFVDRWPKEALREAQAYDATDGKTAHQRDWDILSQAVEDAYAKAGVTKDSPARDQINALVDLQNEHKGQVYLSRHPVDTLLYSSYCTGAANLFCALCMIAGFPARTINNAIHSMSEVWDGNRWLFVDNLTSEQLTEFATKPGQPAEAIFDQNYLQMLAGRGTAPDGSSLAPAMQTRYADEQPYFEPFVNIGTHDWRFNHGRMGLAPSLTPMEAGVGLFALPCADNMKALYPEWDEPILFSRSGRDNELSLTPRQGWIETVARVDRELGIRKSFYIGSLEPGDNPVRSVRADLHLSDAIGFEFNPIRGGWNLLLNGKPLSLDASVVRQTSGVLSFEMPVDGLLENQINTLELYSDKRYDRYIRYRMPDGLAVRLYPDGLGTELPWYGNEKMGLYQPAWKPPAGSMAIYDTHSAWLMSWDSGKK